MAYEAPVYPLGNFTAKAASTSLRVTSSNKTIYSVTLEIQDGTHRGTQVVRDFWVEDANERDYEALDALGYDGSDLRTAKLPNLVHLKIVESKTKPGKQLVYVNERKAQSSAPVDAGALQSVAANFRAFKARKGGVPAAEPEDFDRF